jgi:hypothetical protein
MSRNFDATVDVALEIERELRRLTPGKPSLRCFISLCLERAGEDYSAVEQVKERMTEPVFALKSGCAVFIRDLSRQIASGRLHEPPAKGRVASLYFNQKDAALMELGGQPERLFLLWVVAAEVAYQQEPGVFGTVEDLAGHKARIAELAAQCEELHERFPSSWAHNDLHIGKITSDGAALITFAKAPGEVPVHPAETAGQRLVEYLLRQEVAKAGVDAEAA